MIRNNRIIFEDDTTLNDLSLTLNDIHSGNETIAMVAADDYLYIGSDFPFNHRYFKVSTANENASVVSVELYTGSEWDAAVDVLDGTASAGATLAQSGIISWVPDRTSGWSRIASTEDIDALSTLKIYDFYWARLKVSADLSATTALSFVGFKFSDDNDLASLYPELNTSSVKTAFSAGKTDWIEQQVFGADIIISDLIKKQRLISANQILNWEKFTLASTHKLATIIFRGLGDDWKDNLEDAEKEYWKAINMFNYEVDKDKDGRLDIREKVTYARVVRV